MVHGFHPGSLARKAVDQAAVYLVQHILGEVPARDPRLVGGHEHPVSGLVEQTDGLAREFVQAEAVGMIDVAHLARDGAVEVEENGSRKGCACGGHDATVYGAHNKAGSPAVSARYWNGPALVPTFCLPTGHVRGWRRGQGGIAVRRTPGHNSGTGP